jgi:hypothetical protein
MVIREEVPERLCRYGIETLALTAAYHSQKLSAKHEYEPEDTENPEERISFTSRLCVSLALEGFS